MPVSLRKRVNWYSDFFNFDPLPERYLTREDHTTTERKLWFSGAWGRSHPTSIRQFGPDCIACHYYPEFVSMGCSFLPVLTNALFLKSDDSDSAYPQRAAKCQHYLDLI